MAGTCLCACSVNSNYCFSVPVLVSEILPLLAPSPRSGAGGRVQTIPGELLLTYLLSVCGRYARAYVWRSKDSFSSRCSLFSMYALEPELLSLGLPASTLPTALARVSVLWWSTTTKSNLGRKVSLSHILSHSPLTEAKAGTQTGKESGGSSGYRAHCFFHPLFFLKF